MPMKKFALILAAFMCLTVLSYGQQYYKIKNRWKGTFLNVEHGSTMVTEISPGWHSAMWEKETLGGDIKFKNRWKNSYLIANEKGVVSSEAIEGKKFREMLQIVPQSIWIIERVEGTIYVRLLNKVSGTYLNIENGKLECSEIGPGAHSAMWEFIPE